MWTQCGRGTGGEVFTAGGVGGGAGRLRRGGGFFRREDGGWRRSVAGSAAAGNPSPGAARGMVGRAVAFPEEGARAGHWSGAGRGLLSLRGLKMARGREGRKMIRATPCYLSPHSFLGGFCTFVLARRRAGLGPAVRTAEEEMRTGRPRAPPPPAPDGSTSTAKTSRRHVSHSSEAARQGTAGTQSAHRRDARGPRLALAAGAAGRARLPGC